MIRPSLDLQSVIFNHRVAQKLVARFVELAACYRLVGPIQLDLQILAHVHRVDAVVAHVFEGVLDSFSLRIDHGLLRSDDDSGFHVKAGQAREMSGLMLLKGAKERQLFLAWLRDAGA